jgi:hypothetical protein
LYFFHEGDNHWRACDVPAGVFDYSLADFPDLFLRDLFASRDHYNGRVTRFLRS